VAEVTRFLMMLWNVYSFFVTYANIDRFIPGSGGTLEPSELDKWITSELNQLIVDVDGALEAYNPTEAGRKVESFVNDLSNWYVRRSRRRFWKSENDADKLAAYNTLYECLVTLAKLLAPFTPFLAEELYQNLVGSVSRAPQSVHLTDFPVADVTRIDKQLAADTRLAMKIVSLGRAVRSKAGIKVRQPLARVFVVVPSGSEREGLEKLESQLLEELNVKGLRIVSSERELRGQPDIVFTTEGGYTVAVEIKASPELLAEGLAREIVHRLQTMRRSAGFDIADRIVTYYQGGAYVSRVMEDFADYIKRETLSRELVDGVPPEGAFTEGHRLDDHDILLAVRRLG